MNIFEYVGRFAEYWRARARDSTAMWFDILLKIVCSIDNFQLFRFRCAENRRLIVIRSSHTNKMWASEKKHKNWLYEYVVDCYFIDVAWIVSPDDDLWNSKQCSCIPIIDRCSSLLHLNHCTAAAAAAHCTYTEIYIILRRNTCNPLTINYDGSWNLDTHRTSQMMKNSW